MSRFAVKLEVIKKNYAILYLFNISSGTSHNNAREKKDTEVTL